MEGGTIGDLQVAGRGLSIFAEQTYTRMSVQHTPRNVLPRARVWG
jgi:hypothetical protein